MTGEVLNFIATIVVAVIGLGGIYLQTHSKEKQQSIENKLDAFREESARADQEIRDALTESRLNALKRYLISELTKIQSGHLKPTEEQKRVLKEAKDTYNGLGGDSYVDELYEDARKNGLI